MSVLYTAGELMDMAAALQNDVAKQLYTYAAQLPYLKMSLKELRELFELNNISVTETSSALINVPAGISTIGFATSPALPSDLVDIREVWESTEGLNKWIPMVRREFISHTLVGVLVSSFGIWSWKNNAINVLASNQDNDIKLDYIKELFTTAVDQNSVIGVINAELFLSYRTGGLLAEFVGENASRADKLNNMAYASLERISGIENKSKQSIPTRRRPFRIGYKSRGIG